MKTRGVRHSPAELLAEAARWRLLSLLLLRPTEARKSEVRWLAAEMNDARVADAARDWCEHAAAGAYLQLLGPGGLVPSRAVAYRPFADPGLILADIRRSHAAFGFHGNADEPVDHFAVLADFVSYLLFKEAYARHLEKEHLAELTARVRAHFVEEHLSPMALRLAERLEQCGATEWSRAAHLIAEKVPPPPKTVETAPEDDVLQCGNCVAPQ